MRLVVLALAANLMCSALAAWFTSPAISLFKGNSSAVPLLRNGEFQETRAGKLVHWQGAANGYRLRPGGGCAGATALECENTSAQAWSGAHQTVTFSSATSAPLRVRGWSRADKVSGSADQNYSLYVDIIYADGAPLWGQTANFTCGTHDWEQREFFIFPEKPVRSLTLHCLFRGHTGKVWFSQIAVEELRPKSGLALYQGATILLPRGPSKPAGKARTVATQDGLQLTLRDSTVAAVQAAGRQLAAAGPSGFLARDVAANSDVYAFRNGVCSPLKLKLQWEITAHPSHLRVRGRVTSTRRADRAVTLIFALPLEATGWTWADDVRQARLIEGTSEYCRQVNIGCGATGTMSLYPLAAVHDPRTGLAVGLDMTHPAQYRLAYHAGLKQLLIAYDFALAPDTDRFPNSADFSFVLFGFDPRWGFRAAFAKYLGVFPEQFLVRSKEQGIWMPFTDVSTVQGWEDFGFKYHEGNNNVAFDDAQGILSFRYTEPMTWWMTMPKEAPRSLAEAERVRDTWAQGANSFHRQMAQVTRSAAMFNEQGQPCLIFRNEPWCQGAVWSLNPNPHLPGPVNAATIHWNPELAGRLYGKQAEGSLDGEYLDSLEGYVTADLNFRREHFRQTTVPLVFSLGAAKPALFKGLAVFEFTRWISQEVHRLGKLMFANGVPYRFSFLCPWLDIMGTETDWLHGGQYRPAPDSQMCLWRTMSGQKPYLLLLNTDYEAFQPELVEKYFQRCLFYGFFPSMFSHNAADNPYWRNPKWYHRDRELFRKYQPVIKRVAEAGWQPVTNARCDQPGIWVERFGPAPAGTIYLTLFNDTAEAKSGRITVDWGALGLAPGSTARELLTDKTLRAEAGGFAVSLGPQQAAVFCLER